MAHKVKNEPIYFLGIVIIAIYLRIQGLSRGLPFILNPEEVDFISSYLHLIGNFITSPYLPLTDLYVFISSIFATICAKALNLHSIVKIIELDPAVILFPFRVVAFLASIGSVVCVYFITRRFNSFVALGSTAIFALSLTHLAYSATVEPGTISLFFILLSLLFLLNAYKDSNPKLVDLSLLVSFIALNIHPLGIVSMLPIIFVISIFKRKKQPIFGFKKILFFLMLFILLNPLFTFHIPYHLYLLGRYVFDSQNSLLYLGFLLKSIVVSFGFIGAILLAFLPFALKEHELKKEAGIIFIFPVFYLLLLNLLHLTKQVHLLMLLPYVAIAIGFVFGMLCVKFKDLEQKWQQITATVVLFLLFWMPLKGALTYNKLIKLPDTRIVATQWINKKVNEHFVVTWDRNSVQLSYLDALDKNKLGKARKAIHPKRKQIRRRFIAGSKLLKEKNWFRILKKKTDYVVVNSIDIEKAFRSNRLNRSKGNNFKKKYYKELLKEKPIAVFNPYYQGLENKTRYLWLEDLYMPFNTLFKRERFGPVIKIYEL